MKEERIEKAAGDVLDAEIRPYLDALQHGEVDTCFDFIQDQAIRAGGIEGEKMYLARMQAFGRQFPAGKSPTIAELKGAVLVEWGEVKRLRAERGRREKDGAADSAFAVSQ